jgi:uncharacterized protein YwqG
LQELAELEDQEVEIFKLEQASVIEELRVSKLDIDALKRDLRNKVNTFTKSSFENKTSELNQDIANVVTHCQENHADACVADGDFKTKLDIVKGFTEKLPQLRKSLEDKVKVLLELVDKATDSKMIDEATKLFERTGSRRGRRSRTSRRTFRR